MPASTNKELILGVMVGTAGISLLALWYHKVCKSRTTMNLPKFLSLGKKFDSLTLQGETYNEQGASVVFQRRQLQILEKLNELLTNMEELKEEIKFLREMIPKLEEYLQDELGGKVTVHKISPQHRTRKKRLTTTQSAATSNSSEEAESEGGCWKKDPSSQQNYPEDLVTPQHKHHGSSCILQPKVALGFITCRPSSTCKISRKSSCSSSTSNHLFRSGGAHTLLTRLQRRWRQPSRVNFDSQEDIASNATRSSGYFTAVSSPRYLSSRKLSVVSCYRSSILCDPPQGSVNLSPEKNIQSFPKKSTSTDAQKRISFSDSERGSKCFPNLETKAVSPGHWTVERTSYPSLKASRFSLPTVLSSSSQANIAVADGREHGQLLKDSEDALHHRSQRLSTIEQLRSQSVTSAMDVNSIIVEVTSGPFAASPPEEDTSSPIEMTGIRYITANTDTEEQSFPVAKAFNTHIEELKLDVLLQKVDHLRINESNKVESFELLCDHKEKFSEEIEFLWRLVRAYGDMYDLSTNTQEKKHYANIGKTLGERAIMRAPTNGHCHLWYAVLCGYVSEFEGLQNKINCGHLFKEHLDIAIQLLPEEPFLYYLKGRYCYTVSKLSWIEKKMAATLFGEIPSSTVHEALQNFLKTEELQPGYSVSNYMYVAKCYIDLDESQDAWKFCNLALLMPIITKEDRDAHKEVKKIICSLKSFRWKTHKKNYDNIESVKSRNVSNYQD
ncbi:regulator of microtubule dynamics protein 2 isoform X2 [Mesocricetus auratus]|uniref:Regulator of microtubule dynamics protein 2 n=1 Tax=Mesocricetus auratus TaxID=10036 RepID=A0ABM2W6Y3_MESAU|nr:regulator of microtubule dynamics protein 2 isoform X2 [Mesocricetus auratus]